MSWLTPRFLEDASRVVRGVALVAGHHAADSNFAKRAAAADYQATLRHLADVLQQQAKTQASSTAEGAQPAEEAQPAAAQEQHEPQQATRQAQQVQQTPQQAHQAPQQAQQAPLWPQHGGVPSAHNGPAAAQAAHGTFASAAAVASASAAAATAAATAAAFATSAATATLAPTLRATAAARSAAAAAARAASTSFAADGIPSEGGVAAAMAPSERRAQLRERRVPESPFERAFGFASMGAQLVLGSAVDSVARAWTGPEPEQASSQEGGKPRSASSYFITESNAERLATALCRMRGAALKIGQMLSIQDENVLPPQVQAALTRVRQGADVMPRGQLESQLSSELGLEWRSLMTEFDYDPMAAASIGQVHSAIALDGRRCAMKIQYPGVSRSIESDVDNLMRLISIANILPKGMFIDSAARVAKKELAIECDYTWELESQTRFKALVESDTELSADVHVPAPLPELSTRRVMTSEWVHGVPIDQVRELSQDVRDHVGGLLLRLTLRELFDWHFMQTDPNWGNFLYDADANVLNLIDFGAARDFPKDFVMEYLEMVHACARRDHATVISQSTKLGFLTGDEPEVMMNAHCEAGFIVGMPFAAEGLYDFGQHGNMTGRVGELGATMLKHRLKPPPEESYSLHRKLSGAFLACMKLRARVPCQQMFMDTYKRHKRDREAAAAAHAAAGGVVLAAV